MATNYGPVPTNQSNAHLDQSGYRDSEYHTPEAQHLQLQDEIPVGAAQPRFMGHAMDPASRASYASSSQRTFVGDDYYPPGKGFYGVEYSDQSQADLHAPGHGLGIGDSPYVNKEQPRDSPYLAPNRARSRRKKWFFAILIAGVLVIIAVAVGIYFAVAKPKKEAEGETAEGAASNGKNDSGDGKTTKGNVLVTGGDGSEVTMDDGTKMKYRNSFGGRWYWNPQDPLNNGAQCNSWTPALNETFKFGENVIQGYVMQSVRRRLRVQTDLLVVLILEDGLLLNR